MITKSQFNRVKRKIRTMMMTTCMTIVTILLSQEILTMKAPKRRKPRLNTHTSTQKLSSFRVVLIRSTSVRRIFN